MISINIASKSLCAFLVLAVWAATGNAVMEKQYKAEARKGVALVADGKLDQAKRHFEACLDRRPGDTECLFGLALTHANCGEIDLALKYVERALESGLPFGRFLAGPRDLLEPLKESAGFKELAKEQDIVLVHGPLLGCVTDRSARFWVRTAAESRVQVVVRLDHENSGERLSSDRERGLTPLRGEGNTRESRDYTAVVEVSGLAPGRLYSYELIIDGRQEVGPIQFRTFPSCGSRACVHVGFGGGAGYTPWHERMWDTIASRKPHAFLFLGDNVYIDNPSRPAVQEYCYSRRQSRHEFRRFAASTSVYAIWDDHDFTTNDSWGGPEIFEPDWKLPVWRLFCRNWNNPAHGGGESRPGCWFSFSLGDVDFFMLDGRFFRTDPKGTNPTMLGPHQKEWLFDRLRASTASFKVLASPVPWAAGTKQGSDDTWDGYSEEREQIFSFIETNKIAGVFLISADRHRSDVWTIERSSGYTLYEFESSHLTNVHRHGRLPGAHFSYNEKCAFGLLTFDTMLADPEVVYRIVNIDNEVKHSMTVKRSSLSF